MRTFIKSPIRLLVAVGLLVVVLEAALRLVAAGMGYVDDPNDLVLYQENPHGTGSYRYRPNVDVIYRLPFYDQLFPLHVTTNAHGMRWREVSIESTAGTERIAFLGDGFVAGSSAPTTEEGLVGVFESLLDDSAYEVLNFGVDGYGLDDMALYVEEEVTRFGPKHLVVMIDTGNDFREAYFGVDKYEILSSGPPRWRLDIVRERLPAELAERPHHSTAAKEERPLLKRFALARLLRRLNHRLLAPFRDAGELHVTRQIADFEVEDEFFAWTFWSRKDYPEVAVRAMNEGLGYLADMHAICQRSGGRLYLVAIPSEQQIYATQMQGVDKNGVEYDISYPQKYIETFASGNSIAYLDLLPPLRAHVRNGGVLYPVYGDQHFNAEGQRVVAEQLVAFFRRELTIAAD